MPILLGLGLLVGVLRETVLAYVFGTGSEVEIFRVAYGLPMIVSEGLAVSFVSALVATNLRLPDRKGLGVTMWAGATVALLTAVLGYLTMPLQTAVLAPGFSDTDQQLLTSAGRLCWIANFALLLSYPLRSGMSARWANWPGAMGPLLRNGTFIVVLLALATMSSTTAYSASVGVLAAAWLVLLAYVAIWWFSPMRGQSATSGSGVTRSDFPLIRSLTLALVSVSCSQVLISGGRILDRMAASLAPQGALASVEYSYGIIMALAAIVATSLNLVMAPRVGRTFIETGSISRRHWRIFGMATLVSLALGLFLAVLSRPLVTLVYERGKFDAEATSATAAVFSIQAAGFGALIASLLLTQLLIQIGGHRQLISVAGMKLVIKGAALWILFDRVSPERAVAISFCIAEFAFACGLGASIFWRLRRRHTQEAA